jgi:hypothetical protein
MKWPHAAQPGLDVAPHFWRSKPQASPTRARRCHMPRKTRESSWSGRELTRSYGCEPLAGRMSLALIQRCLPSAPRTRPSHSRRSFTHQSSCPAFDHVAISTGTGGLTSRRCASLYRLGSRSINPLEHGFYSCGRVAFACAACTSTRCRIHSRTSEQIIASASRSVIGLSGDWSFVRA